MFPQTFRGRTDAAGSRRGRAASRWQKYIPPQSSSSPPVEYMITQLCFVDFSSVNMILTQTEINVRPITNWYP